MEEHISGAINLTTKQKHVKTSPEGQAETGPGYEWKDIKMTLPMHVLTRLIQKEYMYPAERRIKRDAQGTTSVTDFCRKAGSQTPDGHLHLCSTCSHTTTLTVDKFPRILNEVWCNTQNTGCMFTGNRAHGSCIQSSFFVTMLRKKANSCMTVIKDGAHYITDEWETYFQKIKLGCECVINKVSPFAKYVFPPV